MMTTRSETDRLISEQPVKLLDLPPELLATIVEYYMTVHGRHSGFAYDHLSHIARPYEGILAEETATIVNTLLKPLRCSRTLFETALQKVMRMNVIIIRAHLEIVGISDPLDSHTWITHEPARLLANVRFIDLTLELGGYELCEDRQFYLEAEEGFSLEGHRQRLPRALNVIAHVPEIFPRLQAVHFYLDLPQRADYAWSPPANLTSWTETDPWGKWWQEREAVLKSLALIVREVAAMPGLRKTMARDYLVLDSKRVQVAGMNDEEVATKILTAGYEETLFCF